MRRTLHVVDATAELFRAFFARPSHTSPAGFEVGALRGLAQWLLRTIQTLRPTHLACVFDAEGKTFRSEISSEYKSKRKTPPEELSSQVVGARELTTALGIATFHAPGYEADDLIATLIRRARSAGLDSVVITPDKDVLQLLADDVSVLEPKELVTRNAAFVRERFGVEPHQLRDFLALSGDSSDDVPGVAGVGPKAAAALLGHFGDLDGIYDGIDEVPNLELRGAKSLATKLALGRASAETSRRLVTLVDDAPLTDRPLTLGDLRFRGPGPGFDGFWAQTGLGDQRAFASRIPLP